MLNFWNRLSVRTKAAAIKTAFYVVTIIAFWFLGKKHLMDSATAFFGLAALTLVFELVYWFVGTKILGE